MKVAIGQERTKPSSTPLHMSGFRPDIEGLRAIAILLVVLYHAGVPGFGGGYVGVDVFFVLSGYLITGLIVREIEEKKRLDLWGFYARRARRLLPGLAVTLLVTAIVSAAVYAPIEQVGFGSTAMATAAYASNIYFARSATDYFQRDADQNPLLHTWSLAVEEQFYLAWPLFVMLAFGAFSWRRDISRRRLLLWTAIVAVVSFGFSLYLTQVRQPWAYFLSPSRGWEFAIGAAAVLLSPKHTQSPARQNLENLLGWAGLIGILISAAIFSKTTVFPGFNALLPTVATVMVLRASHIADSWIAKLLSIRPFQEIGRLSYSWYLWHWPVLVIGSALASEAGPWRNLGLLLLSLGISVLSYSCIENPIRHNRLLSKMPAYSLGMAVLLCIGGVGLSLAWRQASLSAATTANQQRFTYAQNDGPAEFERAHCMQDYSAVDVQPCVFGDERSSKTIVLIGDSHAAQWFPALEPIASNKGWKLVTLIKAACAPFDAEYFYQSLGRVYTECPQWRSKAIEKVRELRPVLTVIASSEGYEIHGDEWRNAISSVLKNLSESSQDVLLLRDTPAATFDIPTCLARKHWRPAFLNSDTCEFAHLATSRVYELERAEAKLFTNVRLADLSQSICSDGLCRGERDNLVVYRDGNHLTASFVKHLEAVLQEHVDKAVF